MKCKTCYPLTEEIDLNTVLNYCLRRKGLLFVGETKELYQYFTLRKTTSLNPPFFVEETNECALIPDAAQFFFNRFRILNGSIAVMSKFP